MQEKRKESFKSAQLDKNILKYYKVKTKIPTEVKCTAGK